MTEDLIECIPNISLAEDEPLLSEIIETLENVPGLYLLHVDSSKSIKRTVLTLVGNWTAVSTAVRQLTRLLLSGADLRYYESPHPHVGLLDVCPFVPVRGVSDQQCIELVEGLAVSINDEFGVPVYFYEKSAKSPDRQRLEFIRKGGKENLKVRILHGFRPDVGEQLHITAGAIVMGVRDYLVAYNINLNSADASAADSIARYVRKLTQDSVLNGAKAIGWYNADYRSCQVSINLTDPGTTGMFTVFDHVSHQASTLGLNVVGSELIGMITNRQMVLSGLQALMANENNTVWTYKSCLEAAISYLGLDRVRPFVPEYQILDQRFTQLSRETVIF